MQEWYLGREKCPVRCPLFRGVLIEGFHCLSYSLTNTYMYTHIYTQVKGTVWGSPVSVCL